MKYLFAFKFDVKLILRIENISFPERENQWKNTHMYEREFMKRIGIWEVQDQGIG
jgi:hypothetical protein